MSLSGWRPAVVTSWSSRKRLPAFGPRLTTSSAEPGRQRVDRALVRLGARTRCRRPAARRCVLIVRRDVRRRPTRHRQRRAAVGAEVTARLGSRCHTRCRTRVLTLRCHVRRSGPERGGADVGVRTRSVAHEPRSAAAREGQSGQSQLDVPTDGRDRRPRRDVRRSVSRRGSTGQRRRRPRRRAGSSSSRGVGRARSRRSSPSPYGSELISSGLSRRAPRCAPSTVPVTGAKRSETLLVDSTSPTARPCVTVAPTAGSETNTTSPSASCA